jgi:hypothetical protein
MSANTEWEVFLRDLMEARKLPGVIIFALAFLTGKLSWAFQEEDDV